MSQEEVVVDLNEIEKKVPTEVKLLIQNQKKLNKLNVLVIGKTGVGKSTLINTIFGRNVVRTGSGEPVTKKIVEIKIHKSFSIYDTKGLEMSNFEATLSDISQFIDQKAHSRDPIHIVWFCISESGRRLEVKEKMLFDMIKKRNIPTIAVITKAQQDKDYNGEKFSDVVKTNLEISSSILQRVRALEVEDDDGIIKKIAGVDDLITKTFEIQRLADSKKVMFAKFQTYNKNLKKSVALDVTLKHSVLAASMAAENIAFSDIALLLPVQMYMLDYIASIYNLEISREDILKILSEFDRIIGVGFEIKSIDGDIVRLAPFNDMLTDGIINSSVAAKMTKLIGEIYTKYLDENFDEIYDGEFDPVANLNKQKIKYFITNKLIMGD
ncbi:MAG: 50S ribosome-binding GTPase [Campylobacter sp.]|nr:50S ribosome-binding GTPase [Campylobacter sp.]